MTRNTMNRTKRVIDILDRGARTWELGTKDREYMHRVVKSMLREAYDFAYQDGYDAAKDTVMVALDERIPTTDNGD